MPLTRAADHRLGTVQARQGSENNEERKIMARYRREEEQTGLPLEADALRADGEFSANVDGVLPSGAPPGLPFWESREAARINGVSGHGFPNASGRANDGLYQDDIPGQWGEATRLPIGEEEINEALSTLREYQSKKEPLDRRIRENNKWWGGRNWDGATVANPTDPRPSSAWLINSVLNKHADMMDNIPGLNVLPRSEDDEETAGELSKVLPVVLEQANFEEIYDRACWRFLIHGGLIFSVTWDTERDDVGITSVDPLSFFWKPGISDIKDSPNIFVTRWVANDELKARYPQIKSIGGSGDMYKQPIGEIEGDADHAKDTVVIDWYYRRGGILHYCKFIPGEVLFSSENEAAKGNGDYADGFYSDGDYPFVVCACYPIEDSPFGKGPVDHARDPQRYIDRLDSLALKSAFIGSRPRYFVREDGGVNEKEFADTTKELVHVAGTTIGEESIRQIETRPLDSIYVSLRQQKIDELKETTGNRDFSQGGTAAGVTSGSAIAALQEAGNKLSRDQIKALYRAFKKVCNLVIERMRQFYSQPRVFRITGEDGRPEFTTVTNEGLVAPSGVDQNGIPFSGKEPIFDIEIKPQKSSPFSREIQNQRAQELFGMGLFNPQLADQALCVIDMMEFEGKERVRRQISQNGGMYAQIQQLIADNMRLMDMLGMTAAADAGAEEGSGGGAPRGGSRPQASKSESEAAERLMNGGAIAGANTRAADAMRKKVQNGASV